MSRTRVKSEARRAITIGGGSTRTKKNRAKTVNIVCDVFFFRLNIQLESFTSLRAAQVHRYIEYRKNEGVLLRSLQNEMSDIRQILRALGCYRLANSPELSNASLGISGASRDGTHRSLTSLQYQSILALARVLDPAMSCCIELQRELGLRREEAIRCVDSLAHWLKKLREGRPYEATIRWGTKGGRPRHVAPVHEGRATEAVERALAVAKVQGGRLVQAASLKAAGDKYGAFCRLIGLAGEYASHALRAMYARDRQAVHMETYNDRRKALAATSQDLGHGDGRGRYIAQVYLLKPPTEVTIATRLDIDKLTSTTRKECMSKNSSEKREQLLTKRKAIADKARADIKRIDAELAKLDAQERAQVEGLLRAIKNVGLDQLEQPAVRNALQGILNAKLPGEFNGSAPAGGAANKKSHDEVGKDDGMDND